MIKKITLLALFASVVVANDASAQTKLVAKTHSIFRAADTYTEDSVQYFHSGTKGTGAPKFDIPEFQMMEDSFYTYEYNTTTKALEIKSKTVVTYSASNNVEQKVTQTMNSGSWRNSSRARIVYASNKPDTVYYETWSSRGNSWRLSSAMVYTWSNNNVATATSLSRTMGGGGNPPAWRNEWRKTYSWNAANKMTDSIYADWNNNAWENIEKRVITYDASNKRNVMNRDGWVSGAWSPFFKTNYEYDASARLIARTETRYNSGNWEPNNRDTLMYNAGNTTNMPDTIIKLVATVGPLALTEKLGFEYNGLIHKKTTFSWDGVSKWNQLNGYDSIDVWYWGYNVGINEVAKTEVAMNVYPNPATDVLHINIDGVDNKQVSFAIVNVEGKTINSWQTLVPRSGVSVSLADMPSGIYFLQMNDGERQATRKFVVQR